MSSDMAQRITQQQLESYLWGAATLLRGTIDAGDYKQFIFPLLFYKRLCDVFDEETQTALAESDGDEQFALFPENHRFQIPLEAHWRQVRQAARDVGRALQNALRAIETANPDKLYGIFGDAQWTNKDRLSDAMLRDLVEHFSALDLTIANLPEDELGQGYEYLIKKFADDSGHTAAEFYTNRTVVHDVLEEILTDLEPGKRAKEVEIKLIARLRKHLGHPKFTALGERLEKIKERHEQGFLTSLEFLKQILEIAKEVVEAEKETDPEEERERAKEALTELFQEAKNTNTHIIVERIVTDIDDIVKKVRFPDWQHTSQGERLVQKELRRTLLKYKLHTDQDLFDKAYGYIRQYY